MAEIAKPTPGPWEVWGQHGYGALNGVQVREVRTHLVLAVAIGDVPELKAAANATLIAAAPEKLSLIKELLELTDDGSSADPEECVFSAARSLISRMEG